MISAILFLNERGDTILVRDYRGDIKYAIIFLRIFLYRSTILLAAQRRSSTDAFRNAIIVKKNTKFPIVQIGSANFLWIREKNIYICACTPQRCNAAVVFEVLYRLIGVFKAYFKGEFDEGTIMSHAGLMLELLDGFFFFFQVSSL